MHGHYHLHVPTLQRGCEKASNKLMGYHTSEVISIEGY